MKDEQNHAPAHAAFVPVTGKLPALNSTNLNRLSVFLTRGKTVLSEAPVSAAGTFHLYVAPHLTEEPGVFIVLGPKGSDAQSLATHADLPRVALGTAKRAEHGALEVDFSGVKISDEIIDPWWIWCREYTVSGTLLTAAACPIGAQVTVYNVTSGVSGLVKTPLATVTTDSNGNFTASFNWCSSRFCWWPCWPFWWHCWPWWWELDILAVIESVERRLTNGGIVALSDVAPLRQPANADLMTGVGFGSSRIGAELQPDASRTALIASKFANPALREIFPWWWWCCENPNIVFSATQGSTTILDEDPNTSTRWCFASGQTVSLTGNSQSIGACQVNNGGPCGFAWSSVGDDPGGINVTEITLGYADGTPGAMCSNMAFNGNLNLNGVIGGDCIAFYNVLAGDWSGGSGPLTAGNPARGGTGPSASEALAITLTDTITIWDGTTLSQPTVVLGPCSFNGVDNLYMTRAHRQNPPAGVVGLPPFPTIPAGAVWGWDAPDLVLSVEAGDLITPALTGGVTLSFVPYDIAGNHLPSGVQPVVMGPDLTLMIDTTPLTSASIDWTPGLSGVFNSDGSAASVTAGSSAACPAYLITTPTGYVKIHTTVVDSAGHLCEYYIQTQYGAGTTANANPYDRDYSQPPGSFSAATTPPPYGVDAGYGLPNNTPLPPPPPAPAPGNWTYVGGGDTFYFPITESCCYDFQLWVAKRTTNGQTFFCSPGNPTFQTVNITVAPAL